MTLPLFPTPPPRTIGSLFAGIGGFDLGAEAAGLGDVAWQVEIDPYCRAVLAKHWPHVDRSVTDVRTASASNLRRVATIIGGFPCQDVSGAGKGAGLDGERSGLWFEYLRIIGELQPRAVIVENVASDKARWLCAVRSGLRTLGYRTRAIQISAAECGAPHLRERVFVLALGNANGEEWTGRAEWAIEAGSRPRSTLADADGVRRLQPEGREPEQRRRARDGCQGIVANTDAGGRRERARTSNNETGLAEPSNRCDVADPNEPRLEGRGEPEPSGADERASWPSGAARPDDQDAGGTQPDMGRSAHGLSARLDEHRWPAPRGAEQHEGEAPRTIEGRQEHRRARLKALGNAIVPHQARAAALVLRDWAAQEGVPL